MLALSRRTGSVRALAALGAIILGEEVPTCATSPWCLRSLGSWSLSSSISHGEGSQLTSSTRRSPGRDAAISTKSLLPVPAAAVGVFVSARRDKIRRRLDRGQVRDIGSEAGWLKALKAQGLGEHARLGHPTAYTGSVEGGDGLDEMAMRAMCLPASGESADQFKPGHRRLEPGTRRLERLQAASGTRCSKRRTPAGPLSRLETHLRLLLIQSVESLAYLKEPLGHSSIQMTVDLYGHLVPGGESECRRPARGGNRTQSRCNRRGRDGEGPRGNYRRELEPAAGLEPATC